MTEITCPSCGKKTDEITRFCPECGARLPTPSDAAAIPPTVVLPPQPAIPATRPLNESPLGATPTQRFEAPPAASAIDQWAATQTFPAPTAAAQPTPTAQPMNNRTTWLLVGGGGCLALIFLISCVSLAAFLAFDQFSNLNPVAVTTVPQTGGGGIVPTLDTPLSAGAVLLRENFDQPSSSVVESSESQTVRFAFEDGAYVIETKVAERIAWTTVGDPYDDIRITVDTRMRATDPVAAIGLVFNHQDDDNFYLYSISNDGYYALEILVEDQWEILIDWTPSNQIDATNNRMSVATRGDRITLYVNDQQIEETRDGTFIGGSAGIALTSFDEAPTQVSFDNLVITRN
ncbi:MAG: zinc-ribbon domain-containing protein [Candidatus Viridilinea halotolerans]|uniref:Zinc-ribbon domain-containing protein n=1 Tax=Candidatus Viridilinea halotolerans TaxID=2491704 RepID=A0A426U8M3_9CHLR|nr:MAG: zinc-ribbon domain-containing protein [Candidatus Viridilinea halotolerans]